MWSELDEIAYNLQDGFSSIVKTLKDIFSIDIDTVTKIASNFAKQQSR